MLETGIILEYSQRNVFCFTMFVYLTMGITSEASGVNNIVRFVA